MTDDAFAAADTDHSGNVTLLEYLDYIDASYDNQMYIDWFAE